MDIISHTYATLPISVRWSHFLSTVDGTVNLDLHLVASSVQEVQGAASAHYL